MADSLGHQPAPCVQSFSEGTSFTTSETAALTKLKMDHEKLRYCKLLNKIEAKSKAVEETCSRNIQQAKDDYLKTVAYARVFQIHGFERYDPFKGEPLDGKVRKRRRKHRKNKREGTYVTLPNLERDNPETLVNSHLSNHGNRLTYATLSASFPQIAQRESDDKENDNKSKTNFNALVMWKHTANRLFNKPNHDEDDHNHSKNNNMSRRAFEKQIKPQKKNYLPGECRTRTELKRFMEQEAMQVVNEMAMPKHKKEENIRKMVQKAQMPAVIKRDKTFSAIVRDFKTYKEEKEERKHKKMIEYVTRHFCEDEC